jgi:hypothetical protein
VTWKNHITYSGMLADSLFSLSLYRCGKRLSEKKKKNSCTQLRYFFFYNETQKNPSMTIENYDDDQG